VNEEQLSGSSVPAAPVAPGPQPSSLSWVWRVFFSPTEVFKEIAVKPSWIWPLAAIILIALINVVVATPRIDKAATIKDAMDKWGMTDRIPPAQLEEQMDKARAEQGKIGVMKPIGAVVMPFVILLIGSLLYWLGLKMFASEASFTHTMSVAAHASLPVGVIHGILSIILLIPRPEASLLESEAQQIVKSNLAALFNIDLMSPTGILTASIDLFGIWQVVLLVFGLSVVGKITKGQSTVVAISVWVLTVLVIMGLVSLPRMLMGK
jgi:hypothetical protein